MILKAVNNNVYEGKLKAVTKFAWLPTMVSSKLIWLHKYQELYEWQEVEGFGNIQGTALMQKTTLYKWVKIDEKIL